MMFTYTNYERGVLKNLYHMFPYRPAIKVEVQKNINNNIPKEIK
jgi:hypothetical protein